MPDVSSKDAKAGVSTCADEAFKDEIVTITRDSKTISAKVARKAPKKPAKSLVDYLIAIPNIGAEFERNTSRSREIDV